MDSIRLIIGKRIRNYRTQLKLSQEQLAEAAGLHPKYIGQLERGEKNATVETLAKVCRALELPMSRLVEKLGQDAPKGRDIPLECYDLIASKTKGEQEVLYQMLLEMDKYKNK